MNKKKLAIFAASMITLTGVVSQANTPQTADFRTRIVGVDTTIDGATLNTTSGTIKLSKQDLNKAHIYGVAVEQHFKTGDEISVEYIPGENPELIKLHNKSNEDASAIRNRGDSYLESDTYTRTIQTGTVVNRFEDGLLLDNGNMLLDEDFGKAIEELSVGDTITLDTTLVAEDFEDLHINDIVVH